MSIDANADLDLGALLVEKKIITQEGLDKALEQQKTRGGYLSQHLIELKLIKDFDLTNTLTCQYGFCYLPLKAYNITEDALSLIPFNVACDYCVIPIEKSDKLLTVVMADPLNKGVLEILRQVTRCEIVVFISTRLEIKEMIEKYYGKPFKAFQLDRFQNDPVLRDNLTIRRISNGLYVGPNRRKYRRLHIEIVGEYYFYPNIIKTKIVNLSMNGVLFESNKAIPKGFQMAMNIHLIQSQFVTVVIEVCRSEARYIVDNSMINSEDRVYYEIGTFFNFMSEENQDMLAEFLRSRLDS